MSIDRQTVEHIAELARLHLTDAEIEIYTEQLAAILDYAERLNALDTSNISPTASVLPLTNVLRDDATQPGLPREQALANAAAAQDGQFQVDAVLDEGS